MALFLLQFTDELRSLIWDLFDFGDPNSITAARTNTIVAPQALFMLNSEFVAAQAQHFAKQLLADSSPNDAARIRSAYEQCLSRTPTLAEIERSLKFLASERSTADDFEQKEIRAWAVFCQALLSLNEFIYVE